MRLVAASQSVLDLLNGLEKSGYCRIDSITNAVFRLLNSFSRFYSHLMVMSFFDNCINGFAILEKLGITLL
jgi:hypothetical protein